MKTKINNIEDLRDVAIETLLELRKGKISSEEAGAASKLCEGILSSVKVEIEYAKLNQRVPKIPFIGELKGALIEHMPTNKLKSLPKDKE